MSKSNYFKGLCVAVALLCSGMVAQAQQFETSVYLNGLFPVGQFRHAYNFNDDGGAVPVDFVPMNRSTVATSAAVGLAATGRFGMWFDVGFGQLLPYVEASCMWNSTRKSIKEVYGSKNTLSDSARVAPTAPHYINVPLTLGLKYRYDITPVIRPFVEFGIGYDVMVITGNGYPKNSDITDMWYSYKIDGKLCWNVGAGTYLGEFVSVGLYYTGLGAHKLDYSKYASAKDDGSYVVPTRNIGELGLRVGFHF